MISIYLLGIIVGILYGLLLNKVIFRGAPIPFVMELPAYRMPSLKTMSLHMWEKAKDFLRRAFTVIFVATIIIWILNTFDFRMNVVSSSANSMLAAIGKLIAPIFKPLGFGNWQASTALITGLSAKEAVVSTLAVLLNVSKEGMPTALATMFTTLSAASFLAFTLLYMPCVAAMAAVRREMGRLEACAGRYGRADGYCISCGADYLSGGDAVLRWIDIAVIIILAVCVFFAVRSISKNKCCGDCEHCAKSCKRRSDEKDD